MEVNFSILDQNSDSEGGKDPTGQGENRGDVKRKRREREVRHRG